jgi:hypothetical protein
MKRRRAIGLLVAAVVLGCAAPAPSSFPLTVCRTNDPIGCKEAAALALQSAPKALGVPARLIVDSGELLACRDPRPIVCPWQVDIEYAGNSTTWSMRVQVQRTSTGEWLLVRVITPAESN